MHALLLGLMLFGADVGIHVELREDVTLAESLAIAEALSAAIAQEIGWTGRVASPEWVSCSGDRTACIRDVKSATHTDQVLMLKIFGTSTRVRVIAERFHLSDAAISAAELDLLRGEHPEEKAKVAALALFPGIRPIDPKISLSDGTAPVVRTSWVPWAVLGASAAALGAGIVFGLESTHGRHELETMVYTGQEYSDRRQALDTESTAANLLFAGALLGGATTVLLLLLN